MIVLVCITELLCDKAAERGQIPIGKFEGLRNELIPVVAWGICCRTNVTAAFSAVSCRPKDATLLSPGSEGVQNTSSVTNSRIPGTRKSLLSGRTGRVSFQQRAALGSLECLRKGHPQPQAARQAAESRMTSSFCMAFVNRASRRGFAVHSYRFQKVS